MNKNPFDYLASEYEAWFVENKVLFHSELLALKQVVPADKKELKLVSAAAFLPNSPVSDTASTHLKRCLNMPAKEGRRCKTG